MSSLEATRGTHTFKIAGYSLHRSLVVNVFVTSTRWSSLFTQATPLPFSTKSGSGGDGALLIGSRPGQRPEPRRGRSSRHRRSCNLGKLLEEKKGADVAFKVGGEVFAAHKMMPASRSPVFDAELFGSMAESSTSSGQRCIPIEDTHADVFRALLHFIYTDTMPAVDMGELDDDDGKEMTRHLLVAADGYGMERLKVMCKAILCESIDVDNVATLLALADQHHCEALGNACAVFIAASSNRMGNVVASQGPRVRAPQKGLP
ncbi:hypothetical protein HU200_035706 [Digitaria exilis]|uniref:BTB domain-containing protein n=1 Tax=Digitaria exilis TaxID=1010633 RepID=A0A835BFE0_9POAL|nr:hypothetical protein HU200_035706 [Digitaria exilis]